MGLAGHFAEPGKSRESVQMLFVLGPMIVGLAGLQMTGALLMLRLRGYPLAATAAILATIPWSPAWPLGLAFGIWACIVLGKPEVTEAFYGDARRAGGEPAEARPESPGVVGRFRSLLRSVGRLVLPSRQGPGPDSSVRARAALPEREPKNQSSGGAKSAM
jgi:hypothetical protein